MFSIVVMTAAVGAAAEGDQRGHQPKEGERPIRDRDRDDATTRAVIDVGEAGETAHVPG
jgi:hypothetical protein